VGLFDQTKDFLSSSGETISDVWDSLSDLDKLAIMSSKVPIAGDLVGGYADYKYLSGEYNKSGDVPWGGIGLATLGLLPYFPPAVAYRSIKQALNKSPTGKTIPGQKGSGSTQVATTGPSYKNAAKLAKIKKGDEVLDHGAGLGKGADEIRKTGASVETLEPNPQRWKSSTPLTYTNSDQINKQYDKVISLNVLNVLEPDLRSMVTMDIISKIKHGGSAIIGARSSSAVKQVRNFTKMAEEGAIMVHKSSGDSYQKGFSSKELREYVLQFLPEGYSISPIKNGKVGNVGVKIVRGSK
jgi:hypothetical protein